MSLRPIAAHWFELVTVHKELARVMECLSRTGAVELEARSRATDRLLFPGLDEALKSHRDMARRYQHYWPAPAVAAERHSEYLSETLEAARTRLSAWAVEADPIITDIEKLSQEAIDLEQLRAAMQSAGADFPDLHRLSLAGPKLQVRLLLLPAGVLPRELPALVLFKPWQTPGANYALVVGRPSDIAEIEAQLQGLKGHVLPLPSWLPASSGDAVTAMTQRLTELTQKRTALNVQLTALSDRQQIAAALGAIALIEWLSEHAKELRGSDRLAWVTGWTSDITGAALRRALDGCDVRYILRLADAPAGMNAPLVLHNPGWARAFEVFARMLGTPGRNESDPSQLLAFIASAIFGFMFGDVGQGAVVLIAGLVLGRRIPLVRMLVPGGIMAMVFGVLFGSVFGREDIIPALWLQPMQEPIAILIAAVVVGTGVITLGLMLDAVQMHWRGEVARWWVQRVGLVVAYAGLLVAPLRMDAPGGDGTGGGLVRPRRRGAGARGPARRIGRKRGRVHRADAAPPGQHRILRTHRRIRARPCRAVARHHRDGECERPRWLLDRARDRQRLCDCARGRGGEHPNHAPAVVRILHPLPERRGARVQAAAATGHCQKHRARTKREGHLMRVNLKWPALMLALAGVIAVGATFLLLMQMTPAAAQTAARAASNSTVAPWAMMAAAIAAGLSTLAAGYAVAVVGSAAVGAVAEKPELIGRVLILVGLAEGIAIYGLIVAVLILNRAG